VWLDEEYSEEPGPDFLSGAAQKKFPGFKPDAKGMRLSHYFRTRQIVEAKAF
jgi:hypothetical protein